MPPSPRLTGLYEKWGPRIAVIVSATLRLPRDVVQDAVQDIFLALLSRPKLSKHVESLSEGDAFRYLLVSVRRRAAREARRRAAREMSLEDMPILPEDAVSHLAPTILLESIGQMKSPYREVLQLLLLEQKSTSEIAKDLRRPVNTVYQQVSRGLARLRVIVQERQGKT